MGEGTRRANREAVDEDIKATQVAPGVIIVTDKVTRDTLAAGGIVGCSHPLDLLGSIVDGRGVCGGCGETIPDPFAAPAKDPSDPSGSAG